MRVIVTRPEREARRWVQALVQGGLDARALPLLAIHPAADLHPIRAAWEHLADYAALMFVSAAAVENFFAARPPSETALCGALHGVTRAWVTGPGTAAALVHQGVDPARVDMPAQGSRQLDSEALWAEVGPCVRPGDRVLIVRGSDGAPGQAPATANANATPGLGRDWLAQQLDLAGARVDFVVTYWRGVPAFSPRQCAQALAAASDGSLWLFTSAQAVANLGLLLPRQDWSGARALATHPRIAAAARAAGFGVVWESRPGVADVVASIESIG